MTKTVFTNDMCCHVFAQQTQDEGRTNNGNIFFEGKTIYSYGYHFPMAHFIKPDLIAVNSDSYSVSTSQHQGDLRSAINHIERIYVDTETLKTLCNPYTDITAKRYKKEWSEKAIKEAENALMSASRHRAAWLRGQDIVRAQSALNNVIQLCDIYGFKALPRVYKMLETLQDDQDTSIAQGKQLSDKALKALQDMKKQAERDFRRGKDRFAIKGLRSINNILLRVQNDQFETSHGATFPLEHGKKAFDIIKRCKDTKSEFIRNGKSIHLGHFQIDKICKNGDVKAGCHFVKYAEIERAAKSLKLI